MKKHLFPISVFIAVLVYFLYCINAYGVSNVSFYNVVLFLFASPLAEEYVFRGLVQKKINNFIEKDVILHISYGNIISSVIFAGIHFFTGHYDVAGLQVFLPSLFLGYLFDKYKNIILPVLFHCFFNINMFLAEPHFC